MADTSVKEKEEEEATAPAATDKLPDMETEEEDRVYTSSCVSDGEEYRLYDIVRVYDRRFTVPHIGKILKLWEERSSSTKKVLVCWFLWHKEVKPDDDDNPRELFLVTGKEQGVTNELDMDSIVGKCKVVCTSSDPRNKEPSVSDIENADFIFSHAYDVDLQQTFPVEVVADTLGPDVIYNTQEWLITISKIEGKMQTKKSVSSSLLESKKRSRDGEAVPSLQKKKIDKKEDVKKGLVCSEEAPKKKKIKVADGKTPAPKEKAKESLAPEREQMEQSKRQPLKTETTSKPSKTQIIDVREGTDLDKTAAPGKLPLDKVDIIEQTQSINKRIVRQVDDEAISHDILQNEDTQKSEPTVDITSKIEKAQTKEGEEADNEAGMPSSEKIDLKRSKVEHDISLEADRNNESISKILKKTRPLPSIETQKRLNSAPEAVKPFEKRRIFKELPWEENLQRGIPLGKVLLLQNIDPFMTSADIREMLKKTFQGLSDARVLPKESICPSGQAIAIFETKLLADNALEAMERDCLVMADRKWPVIGSRVKEPVNQAKFPGHLALEKLKLGRNLVTEDYRKAVSTSHCSQPNTIEFEMAMEWRQLQEITQTCRLELFKKQRRELNDLRSHGSGKAQKSKQDRV